MQQGLDGFANAGFQVDARLYAMAVGYTLGTARAGREGDEYCRRRRHARRALVVAALVVTTVVTGVVMGSRRTRF